jgi:uncharacterized membrane protein YkvA (DUF1232 family)
MTMTSRVQRVASFLADPRVPKLPRFAVLAAVAYLLTPVDLVPELVFPLVGWLDDITLVWLAVRWLVKKGDDATGSLARMPPPGPPR